MSQIGLITIAVGPDTDEIDSNSIYPIMRSVQTQLQSWIDGKPRSSIGDLDWMCAAIPVPEVPPQDKKALLRWAIQNLQTMLATEEHTSLPGGDPRR